MKFRVRQVAIRVKVIVSVLKTNVSQCVGLISDGYTACVRERVSERGRKTPQRYGWLFQAECGNRGKLPHLKKNETHRGSALSMSHTVRGIYN